MGLSAEIYEAVKERRYVTNYKVKLALCLSKEGKIKLQREIRENTNYTGNNFFNGYSEFAGLPVYENELQKEDFTIIKKV